VENLRIIRNFLQWMKEGSYIPKEWAEVIQEEAPKKERKKEQGCAISQKNRDIPCKEGDNWSA